MQPVRVKYPGKLRQDSPGFKDTVLCKNLDIQRNVAKMP